MAEAEYTRLHITPFSPALLKTFLPASILPSARNISYHNIQTFPEKDYGYVELPTMEAEKIKKKLNGSILKGTKVRIEKARPAKDVVIEAQEPEPPKREKKKKRERDELPGVDIGERQVKRGWTVPTKEIAKSKDKKPVNKSKYTTGPECLFKTNLPPNVASQTKVTQLKVEKKIRKAGKETVVHEFAKTTKYATFLRGSSGANKTKHAAEFVEGKGWVDEEGNLVEEVITKKRKHKAPTPEPPKEASRSSESEDSDESALEQEADTEPVLPKPDVKETSASSDSEDSEEESASEPEADLIDAKPTLLVTEANKISSSEDSSDDSSYEDKIKVEESEQPTEPASDSSDSSSSDSSSSDSSEDESEVEIPQSAASNRSQTLIGRSLSIKIPTSTNSTPISASVHPLEALYKRPKAEASTSKETAPSFSFFGADADEEEIEEGPHHQAPLTPFTQKDFEYRGLRSAAPTPDTAHPNKRFVWPTEDDDDDEEPEVSSPIQKKEKSEGAKDGKDGEAESEFQKWFWENRGKVDRTWKARRRAVAKEKRQRENRKRQDRAL